MAPDPTTREAIVIVRGASSALTQQVSTRTHSLAADEPAEFGGDDAGPTPYELLLAGFGS